MNSPLTASHLWSNRVFRDADDCHALRAGALRDYASSAGSGVPSSNDALMSDCALLLSPSFSSASFGSSISWPSSPSYPQHSVGSYAAWPLSPVQMASPSEERAGRAGFAEDDAESAEEDLPPPPLSETVVSFQSIFAPPEYDRNEAELRPPSASSSSSASSSPSSSSSASTARGRHGEQRAPDAVRERRIDVAVPALPSAEALAAIQSAPREDDVHLTRLWQALSLLLYPAGAERAARQRRMVDQLHSILQSEALEAARRAERAGKSAPRSLKARFSPNGALLLDVPHFVRDEQPCACVVCALAERAQQQQQADVDGAQQPPPLFRALLDEGAEARVLLVGFNGDREQLATRYEQAWMDELKHSGPDDASTPPPASFDCSDPAELQRSFHVWQMRQAAGAPTGEWGPLSGEPTARAYAPRFHDALLLFRNARQCGDVQPCLSRAAAAAPADGWRRGESRVHVVATACWPDLDTRRAQWLREWTASGFMVVDIDAPDGWSCKWERPLVRIDTSWEGQHYVRQYRCAQRGCVPRPGGGARSGAWSIALAPWARGYTNYSNVTEHYFMADEQHLDPRHHSEDMHSRLVAGQQSFFARSKEAMQQRLRVQVSTSGSIRRREEEAPLSVVDRVEDTAADVIVRLERSRHHLSFHRHAMATSPAHEAAHSQVVDVEVRYEGEPVGGQRQLGSGPVLELHRDELLAAIQRLYPFLMALDAASLASSGHSLRLHWLSDAGDPRGSPLLFTVEGLVADVPPGVRSLRLDICRAGLRGGVPEHEAGRAQAEEEKRAVQPSPAARPFVPRDASPQPLAETACALGCRGCGFAAFSDAFYLRQWALRELDAPHNAAWIGTVDQDDLAHIKARLNAMQHIEKHGRIPRHAHDPDHDHHIDSEVGGQHRLCVPSDTSEADEDVCSDDSDAPLHSAEDDGAESGAEALISSPQSGGSDSQAAEALPTGELLANAAAAVDERLGGLRRRIRVELPPESVALCEEWYALAGGGWIVFIAARAAASSGVWVGWTEPGLPDVAVLAFPAVDGELSTLLSNLKRLIGRSETEVQDAVVGHDCLPRSIPAEEGSEAAGKGHTVGQQHTSTIRADSIGATPHSGNTAGEERPSMNPSSPPSPFHLAPGPCAADEAVEHVVVPVSDVPLLAARPGPVRSSSAVDVKAKASASLGTSAAPSTRRASGDVPVLQPLRRVPDAMLNALKAIRITPPRWQSASAAASAASGTSQERSGSFSAGQARPADKPSASVTMAPIGDGVTPRAPPPPHTSVTAGMQHLLAAMALTEADVGVQAHLCAALAGLSTDHAPAIVAAGGMKSIITAMEKHEGVTAVQSEACEALYTLGMTLKAADTRVQIPKPVFAERVKKALLLNRDMSAEVKEQVNRALEALRELFTLPTWTARSIAKRQLST